MKGYKLTNVFTSNNLTLHQIIRKFLWWLYFCGPHCHSDCHATCRNSQGTPDSRFGTMRVLHNSCGKFSIEAARLGDDTKNNTVMQKYKEEWQR